MLSSTLNYVCLLCLFSAVKISAEIRSEFESKSTVSTCCPPLPGSPPTGVQIERGQYKNWAQETIVNCIWIAVPKNTSEILELINYANNNDLKIRATGQMHNWSPLTVNKDGNDCVNNGNDKLILIQTSGALTSMRIQNPNETNPLPSLWTQSGALMDDILQYLEDNGYGLTSYPAPGDLTIGGVCAIGGHGAAIPADGEIPVAGQVYGSVSNLITEFTAVVWDESKSAYVLKTFSRSDSCAKAFLVHLGRAFIIDFTLRVMKNYHLRCESRTDIDVEFLFRDPQNVTSSNKGRTFSSFLNTSGRVEAILFPYTTRPWLKVWTVTSTKPLTSNYVTRPYNYPFSDNIPSQVSDIAQDIVNGNWVRAPELGLVMYTVAYAGTTLTADLWGLSKNVLLYIKPTTLRVTATGFSILTTRGNVQQTLHQFYSYYNDLLQTYKAQNKYPVNGPLEVRVCGLDDPSNIKVPDAESPILSSMNPETASGCEYDVIIWLNSLSFPNTPYNDEFSLKLESWLYANYNDAEGCNGLYRPEWTKGWAYTNSSGWADPDILHNRIPGTFPLWDLATTTLDEYDPNHVFSNEFLDNFMS